MNKQAITFDDQALFGPGRAELTVSPWQRETDERSFGGLDGVMTVDLGRRGRDILQRGALAAATPQLLNEQLDELEAFLNGRCYRLTDADGRDYPNVRMDRLRLSETTRTTQPARCDYEIHYRQLSE